MRYSTGFDLERAPESPPSPNDRFLRSQCFATSTRLGDPKARLLMDRVFETTAPQSSNLGHAKSG